MNIIGIIPARFASTRFPGKPLALIAGKPMIQHVYTQAQKALDNVYVATDDERIAKAVKDFGGNVVMTLDTHTSGTDRCAEAVSKIMQETGSKIDVVVNIQGDEPFIKPEQIKQIISCFNNTATQIATLVKPIKEASEIINPNLPKVVLNKNKQALYFSRSPIPYIRGIEQSEWHTKHEFYKHIGMYAYKTNVLLALTKLAPSSLERAESLEQLRWLENGYVISAEITMYESHGIDTPEDLEKAAKYL